LFRAESEEKMRGGFGGRRGRGGDFQPKFSGSFSLRVRRERTRKQKRILNIYSFSRSFARARENSQK